MKAILFLFLISLIACKINFIEIGICLVSKSKIQEIGSQILSKVSTKEYSEILPTLFNSIPDIYKAVTECISKSTNDEPILKGMDPTQMYDYADKEKAPEGCRNAREYGVCRRLDFSPTICKYRHC